MDPITMLAGIKTGLAAGKTVAGLSKQIGQFFDATDQAKKQLQKKVYQAKAPMLRRWIAGRKLDKQRKLKKNLKSGLRKPTDDQNT